MLHKFRFCQNKLSFAIFAENEKNGKQRIKQHGQKIGRDRGTEAREGFCEP